MPPVFRRSRSLTIEDSFHRQQQQQQQQQQQRQQWMNAGSNHQGRSRSSSSSSSSRKLARSNSRKLLRSNSIATDHMRNRNVAATSSTPVPSSVPKEKGKRKLLRSVVGFLTRTKSEKANKPGSFTMTEPASPASAGSLSRTNSDSSAVQNGDGPDGEEEEGGGRAGAREQGDAPLASKPRVSFDADVTTVFIEQMKDEEVRKTFYCRREYAAFKEAYRKHRDTSTDWCRGNDVMPCNCDACQDDLVEGVTGQHIYSTAPYPLAADDGEEDNYDSAFDDPPASSPSSRESKDARVAARWGGGHGDTDGAPSPVCAVFEESVDIPSPVGAVFQDIEEDSSSSCSSSSSRGGGRGGGSLEKPPASAAAARHGGCGQKRRLHTRSRTWGMGSVPIAAPPTRVTHKRGGSLDDWGVNSSVREAVRCHGEGYAYKTLRLQGFSDLYIKTHFLPES